MTGGLGGHQVVQSKHDLRHIHATTLRLSGVPVHVVATRLDHADPAITLPSSEGASEVGAAYRNRTDDLRITSASL
jgi:integrase